MTDVLPVFLPLIGFLIAFLFGKQIGDRGAQIVTCAGLIAAAALSVSLFFDVALGGHTRTIEIAPWISSGAFEASWATAWTGIATAGSRKRSMTASSMIPPAMPIGSVCMKRPSAG